MNPSCDTHYNNNFESFKRSNKLNSVILKCGNLGSALIGQQLLDTVFPAITLKTSSFSKSCIKFNFTSNIISNALGGTLTFQLYKLCDNQINATTVGPQWIFTANPLINTITTFSFNVYDNDICSSEKCNYYVMMSLSGVFNEGVITNATLSALVVDNSSNKLIKEPIFDDKIVPFFTPNLEQHPTVLKCGTPQSTSFPAGLLENITTTATVASVTLNTSCFCKPSILLEYANNIIIPINTAIFSMSFQVFKHCSDQLKPIPVGTQLYFLHRPSTTNNFSFSICDQNPCSNECCTYTVQSTGIIFHAGGGGPVVVENSTLSAIIVDNINEKC
ncbi:DUF4489 domain-containing protein [Alkalibaculum sp. M08DMB]|uniref:DUF4489 domain-containing protein n=1 Tax=Alkalibaculum sporogenes TaxID=2655001 RepID=A0A6A7KC74_9FIRM|nr:DUF4489 domain-containing protein [Alkalibaculum sporogenes]MPW26952.1 DUF4489 domain-containing protein [Alkalibaculum sporogenes]